MSPKMRVLDSKRLKARLITMMQAIIPVAMWHVLRGIRKTLKKGLILRFVFHYSGSSLYFENETENIPLIMSFKAIL